MKKFYKFKKIFFIFRKQLIYKYFTLSDLKCQESYLYNKKLERGPDKVFAQAFFKRYPKGTSFGATAKPSPFRETLWQKASLPEAKNKLTSPLQGDLIKYNLKLFKYFFTHSKKCYITNYQYVSEKSKQPVSSNLRHSFSLLTGSLFYPSVKETAWNVFDFRIQWQKCTKKLTIFY